MRLTTLLRGLPAHEVEAVADANMLPPDSAADAIARHLTQSRVLQNALRTTLRPVTHLIERLAMFGPKAGLDTEILNGVSTHRLDAAHRQGLLFLLPSAADPTEVALPLEYLLMREVRRPPTTDLVSGLRVYGIDQARRLARALDLDDEPTPSMLLAAIHEALLIRVPALARELSAGERTLLDDLLERGGALDAGDFQRSYPLSSSTTARGPFSIGDVFGQGRAAGRPTDAQRLFQMGILHAETERDTPAGMIARVFVPAPLVERLSGAWAARREAAETDLRARAVLPAPPVDVRPGAADPALELRSLALCAQAFGYGFVRGGEARLEDAARLTELRRLPAHDQVHWITAGRLLGVFRVEEARLVLAPDAAEILDLPPTEVAARLRRAVEREEGAADALRPRLRRFLSQALTRFTDAWLRVDVLPELLQADGEYRRTLAVHDVDPDMATAIGLGVLEEMRAWGTVDLAGPEGEPVAVRLRPPTASPPASAIPARPLVVPPNLEVVAPMAAPFDLLATLARFAEPKTLDVAAVFAVSASGLARARGRGIDLSEARAFLAAHCAHPLPETVDRLFADAAEREGEVRLVRTRGVLLVQDPDTALALAAHPAVAPLIIQPSPAPGVLILAADADPDQIRARLERAGFFADES